MKVELQVLATASIKRKKPWPALAFLGQAQESLFLLDKQRVSVLYVPSGKTKRRISSLEPLLHNTTALQYSHEGSFLVGLLTSGDAYLWHKDSNRLKFLQGFESLAYKGEIHVPACQTPHAWVSDSGRHIVASAPGFVDTLVWEAGASQPVLSPNSNQVQGSWSVIEVPAHVLLPGKANFEASSNACFCVKECIGECCLYSCVFYRGNEICVTTLLIQWLDAQQIYSYRQSTYQAEWKSKLHPLTQIDPEATPLDDPGALVTKFSNDGQLLAIAVNQNKLASCKMMYVAPCHDVVVCADLKCMGTRGGQMDAWSVRSYWVTSLQWTHDDLYLVCINGQGLVGMLTRLGEPVLLATQGLSPEIGPRFYLPLHPLSNVQTVDDQDPMRQRFSLAVHPRNPIIVSSDGFVVTVLRYAPDTTCLSLMTSLSAEAVTHLRRVKELQASSSSSVFDSVRQQSQHAMRQKQGARGRGLHCEQEVASLTEYQFEAPEEDALNDTLERPLLASQVSLPNGRITFGDNLNTTLQHAHHATDAALSPAEHLCRAHRALFGAWALAVSHTGVWTTHHEDALSNVTHNLSRLLGLLLSCKASVLKELDEAQGQRKRSSKQARGLRRALHLFTSVLSLLPLDSLHRNAQVCVLDLIHSVVSLLASSPALHHVHPHAQTLQGCYALLRHSEVMMQTAYDRSPGVPQSNVDPYSGTDAPLCNPHLFSPSLSESPRCGTDQTLPKQSLNHNQNASNATPIDLASNSDAVNRLGRSWVYLYRQSMQHYKSLLRTCLQQESVPGPHLAATLQTDSKRILQLLYTLQCRLHSLNQDLPRRKRKHRLKKGDRLCIEGTSSPAVFSWLQVVESSSDLDLISHSVGRLLHGVLYSHLINDDLYSAIELVELLARNGDPRKGAALARQDAQSRLSALSLLEQIPVQPQAPCPVLENALVRHLVVTLARIMGAYFSNGEPFVYPPHEPFRVPPLNTVCKTEHRTVPLYRDAISAAVRQSQLGQVWTPERSLCYLLLGGALVEGVWLLNALGDWKAAFIVSSACVYHRKNLAPELYKRKKKLILPEDLLPVSILKQQLAPIVTQKSTDSMPLLLTEESDFEHLSSTLRDILLATCFCEIDIVPWILETLGSRLKGTVSQLKPLVPAGLYLPAPPVYCPQPASNLHQEEDEEVVEELKLRREASSVVVLISILLSASNTATPALSWYAQRVLQVFTSNLKKRKSPLVLDIEFLRETYLQGSSSFQGHEAKGSVRRVLAVVRDLCSVCWMLHVRDELSIGMRKKTRLADEGLNDSVDAWQLHCRKTLHWCRLLMPFHRFLRDGHDVCHSLISLLVELPQSTEMAKVMAEHFYDLDAHDPDLQDKVGHLLNEWKGVMVGEEEQRPAEDSPLDSPRSLPGESPRGITLSVYYHGKANSVSKLFRQRVRTFGDFEEFVFAKDEGENGVLHVGSRGFESTQEYLQFLDRLYAVSFARLAESETDAAGTWPLLLEFSSEVRGRELRSLSRRESVKSQSAAAHKGQSILVIQSPRQPSPSSPRRCLPPKTVLSKGPRRKGGGLFRSHSLSDGKKPNQPIRKQRSSSDEDILRSNSLSHKPLHCNEEDHPLNTQFVSAWMLDSFSYERGYEKMEQRLDWLNAWSAHNHTLFPGAKDDAKGGALRCAMKLRVSAKLLVYSLWLLDNCHYKAPLAPAPTEITVAAVQRQEVVPPNRTASPARAVPFTPSVVTPDISGIEPLAKEKKKKKKEKKKEEIEKGKEEEDNEVEEMILTQEFVSEVRLNNNTPKKLSFKLPDEDIVIENNQVVDQMSDTEGTLEVSSLNEDELKRSLHESAALSPVESLRLSDLESSVHIQHFSPIPEASPASTLVDQGMNTTGHFDDTRQPAEPPNDEVVGQVQNVVRQEMRRLMEAQHRGILAMMGALDETQTPEVERQTSQGKVEEHSVTSESSRLALSDLGQSDPRRGHRVEEALNDLQLLTNQLSEEKKRKKRHHFSDKENRRQAWQDEPYAGLMNALREMNHELGGQPSPRIEPPSLLRLPSSPEDSVRLPVIPMPPSPLRQTWNSEQLNDRMPLLQLNRSDYFGQQIPERDTNRRQLSFQAPFPLLHLPGDAHLYSDAHPTMPSLASADEVMAYHRKKLEEAQSQQQMLNDAVRQELAKKADGKPQGQRSREKRRKAKKSKEVRKKVKLKKKGDESEDGLESLPMDTQPDTLSALREESLSASKDLGTADSALPQVLHSGYALSQGLCDDFLGKEDEVGLPHNTASNIHYQAAMKLQENSKKKVLKKDMFTETDPIVEEKSTSTHASPRKIGSNYAEPGSILPPDIFMGLQFNGTGSAPASRNNAEGQSNSYINVVDINAEALDDRPPRRQTSRHSPRKTSPRQVKFKSRSPANEAESTPGADPTTLRLLQASQAQDRNLTSLPDEDEVMKNKRYHSKTYIKKRLQDMNEQFNAIESLQRNIEDDFKASKLLAHTIEQFGEAMMPEREEPTARVLERLIGDEGERTPEEAASSRNEKVSARSEPPPLVEGQASPRQRSRKKERAPDVHLSGLSGVSDIVGEMLVRGSVDPEDVGLTQGQAHSLMEKALQSERHGVRLSNEELLNALTESVRSPEVRQGRSEVEKKELQQWMQAKRRERSQEYKRRQAELRDHEKKPFRSGVQLGSTQQEMQEAKQQRQEKKRTLLQDHEEKRLRQASQLMGEILQDKPPEIPEQPIRERERKKPAKKTTSRSKSLPRKISSMEHRVASPRREEWTSFRSDRRPSMPERATSAGRARSARSEPERPAPSVRKPQTQKKSLSQMVRLQRPESTRPKKNRPPPKTYTERLMEAKTSDAGTPRLAASPHGIYGSSRLPHSAKQDDRPRVVKSYTERLQDMKRTRTIDTGPWQRAKFNEPKDTRVMRGGRLTELKRAAILPSKPRKTLSYSEQLRQLQPPKELYRSGTSTFTVKPNRKWHKAPHKPKTYVQQLRELQQPSASREGLGSSVQRSRPYADPYVEVDDASVVSPWSVDDDVQRLINEGSTAQSNTEATDLDLSELQHLADLPYDVEYSDLVGLQDITDVASLGAASSIMSFIDWDQVNDLIADVH